MRISDWSSDVCSSDLDRQPDRADLLGIARAITLHQRELSPYPVALSEQLIIRPRHTAIRRRTAIERIAKPERPRRAPPRAKEIGQHPHVGLGPDAGPRIIAHPRLGPFARALQIGRASCRERGCQYV